ncbi:MAG: hypothetical protein JWQ09_4405 [Segetibacter sp.]|nr:hypothetical protein [Segetibacter sp.]
MKFVIDFSSKEDKNKLYEILKSRKHIKYVVEIKEARESRSLKQNNLYWVYIGILGEHLGYNSKEMHHVTKKHLLGSYEKANKVTSEIETFTPSSKDLDTLEFTQYIENVRLWAMQDFDCYLPTPLEYMQHQIELNTKYLND